MALTWAAALPADAGAAPSSPTPTPSASASGAGSTNKQVATFGVQPVTDGKPDGRPSLIEGVTPGATLTEHVAVINYSLQVLKLGVYATDAINEADGDLTVLPQEKKPTDAGSWIKLRGKGASGHVTVKPKSFVILPVDVRVPEDASPGDHVAGVVASLTAASRGNGVNPTVVNRVGTRVYFRVAGPVTPGLAVEGLSANYSNNWNPVGAGGATVTYRLHNTGNVILGARQHVVIDGLFGETASATPPRIPLLLPGASVNVRVSVGGVVPEVRLTAKVDVTPIVPTDTNATDVSGLLQDVYSASTHLWAVPWVLIGVVIVLAAGGLWLWRSRRLTKRSPGTRGAATNRQGDVASPHKEGVGA